MNFGQTLKIAWEGLNEVNTSLNQQNIAGELITMRDQMKKVKSEDEKRIWITEGLSNFGEIIRSNQNDFKKLSEELISNMVKYLNIQQRLFALIETASCSRMNRSLIRRQSPLLWIWPM